MRKKCKSRAQKCAIQGDIRYISEGFRGKKVQKLKTKLEKRACTWEKKQYSACIVGFCVIWSCVGNKDLTIERESLCLLGQKGTAVSGSQVPGRATQTHPTCPLSHVPAPHLVDFHLSKTMPLLLTFILNSARICKELNFFHLTWSEGQNWKAKLFPLPRSFLSAWVVSKVLAVNESTFHFALFQLWLP